MTALCTPAERRRLLEVANNAVAHGMNHRALPALDPSDYQAGLRAPRASFVTLKIDGRLRGCIGSLEAARPLVEDVNANAFAASCCDRRFRPLARDELGDLRISIAVLSEPEPMEVECEQALIARLRPGVDGLILEQGRRRGTFLPAVWESLPEPSEFLRQLKLKAGLAADHWSPALRIFRYGTESIGE